MPPTVTGDFGSRADAIERSTERTGYDVAAIDCYRGFQHWRIAVIADQVKRRCEAAQMANADVDIAHLDRRVVDLAELAEQHLGPYASQRRRGGSLSPW